MFTDDYYFLIPSNTTITSLGRITLNLKRTAWLPVTVTITKGTDVAEIDTFHNEKNEQPSIVINILKPNRQFEVSVIYFNKVINNITLNTSDEEKNITIANTKVVDEKRQTIKIPYEITGFSQKNITFTYKNKVVNAKSVISILASGVGCGDEITLMAEGPDEEEALKAVSESFKAALQD